MSFRRGKGDSPLDTIPGQCKGSAGAKGDRGPSPYQIVPMFLHYLRKRRVFVEHVIKEIKTFKIIGSLYWHPRWMIASIVDLGSSLTKRRLIGDCSITDEREMTTVAQRKDTKQTIGSFIAWISTEYSYKSLLFEHCLFYFTLTCLNLIVVYNDQFKYVFFFWTRTKHKYTL